MGLGLRIGVLFRVGVGVSVWVGVGVSHNADARMSIKAWASGLHQGPLTITEQNCGVRVRVGVGVGVRTGVLVSIGFGVEDGVRVRVGVRVGVRTGLGAQVGQLLLKVTSYLC